MRIEVMSASIIDTFPILKRDKRRIKIKIKRHKGQKIKRSKTD